MTPAEMLEEAINAIARGRRMTLVVPRPWRARPPGFPRGELLCSNIAGFQAYSFDPMRVKEWLQANSETSHHVLDVAKGDT